MMDLLRDICLQERQIRVRLGGGFGSGVAAFNGSQGSGNRFGRIVLREFRSKVGGEDGSSRLSGSGKIFYGTDVIIGRLKA